MAQFLITLVPLLITRVLLAASATALAVAGPARGLCLYTQKPASCAVQCDKTHQYITIIRQANRRKMPI